ncbi:MAG: hypothetical protein ACOC29_02880, partial [Candidatus Sumerlaeota bacterium]
MARPAEHIVVRVLLWGLVAFAAVLVDLVVAPHLLGGHGRRWAMLSASSGVAIICGMRRGPFAGLACGWWAGLVAAGLTNDPLGLSLLSYGLVGFASGFTGNITSLRLPPFDILLFFALLLIEGFISAGIVSIFITGAFHPGVLGRVLTALLFAPYLLRHPPGEKSGGVMIKSTPMKN